MQNNADFECLWLGTLLRLLLFEGSVLTEDPARKVHAMWMRDWSIPSKVVGQKTPEVFDQLIRETLTNYDTLRYLSSIIVLSFDHQVCFHILITP